MILDIAVLGAFNAWLLSAIVLHLDHDSGGFDLQIHVGDLPRRLQTQKQTIVTMKLILHPLLIPAPTSLFSLKIAH